MRTSNFSFIAPFYDLIVKIVYGLNLWKAQQVHLHKVQSMDSVLILGGGTGQILCWLPNDCEVTYLELSLAMIKRAKKKGEAHFLQADFLTHSMDRKFDWIICPFFLDCFNQGNLNKVLEKIHLLLKKNGRVMIVDFNVTNWQQKFFSNLMIWFFRLISNLQATELLPIRKLVSEAGFKLEEGRFFRHEFIFSDIYSKKETF